MRVLVVVLVMLAGCIGSGRRPGVMPLLTELPADPGKRDAILNQSTTTPGGENRKPLATKKQRRVETTAATAAAILGQMFSKTSNVTIGIARDDSDEADAAIAASAAARRRRAAVTDPNAEQTSDPKAEKPPAEMFDEHGELVPWLRLKK